MPSYNEIDDEEKQLYEANQGKDIGVSPIQTPSAKPWDRDRVVGPTTNLNLRPSQSSQPKAAPKPWDNDRIIERNPKPFEGDPRLDPNNIGNNPPSFAEDVLKSLGSGAVKGAIGLASLPGDIGALIDAIDEKSDVFRPGDPEKIAEQRAQVPAKRGYRFQTSEQNIADFERDVMQLHKPVTTAGKYAQTFGEFLPATFVGPAGTTARAASLARNVGARTTAAAIPAIGSEAAGQIFEGSPLEPYARVAGGFGAHGAQHLVRHGLPPEITSQSASKLAPGAAAVLSALGGYAVGGEPIHALTGAVLGPQVVKSGGQFLKFRNRVSPNMTPVDRLMLQALAGNTPGIGVQYPEDRAGNY